MEDLALVESRDRLLTPGEVATLFRVDARTVTRWAAEGRVKSIRTPGGRRRFRESDIRELLREDGVGAFQRDEDEDDEGLVASN